MGQRIRCRLLFYQGVRVFDKDRVDVALFADPCDFDTGNDFEGLSLRCAESFFVGAIAIRVRDVRQVGLELEMFGNRHAVESVPQRLRYSNGRPYVAV